MSPPSSAAPHATPETRRSGLVMGLFAVALILGAMAMAHTHVQQDRATLAKASETTVLPDPPPADPPTGLDFRRLDTTVERPSPQVRLPHGLGHLPGRAPGPPVHGRPPNGPPPNGPPPNGPPPNGPPPNGKAPSGKAPSGKAPNNGEAPDGRNHGRRPRRP